MPEEGRCCLLIGNTRWHWARCGPEGWHFVHTAPDPSQLDVRALLRWAAVGPVPAHPALCPAMQLTLADVPLKAMPPWLGVDRALAAWAAWHMASPLRSGGLLVADAGTVLSLTRVSADGCFGGGQLAAGVGLQLRAMTSGTRDLPASGFPQTLTEDRFPHATVEAMQRGSVQSLLGLLLEAQQQCRWPLWLCGGDSPLLIEGLHQRGAEVVHSPDLVMQGLVQLIS